MRNVAMTISSSVQASWMNDEPAQGPCQPIAPDLLVAGEAASASKDCVSRSRLAMFGRTILLSDRSWGVTPGEAAEHCCRRRRNRVAGRPSGAHQRLLRIRPGRTLGV